MLHGMRKYLRYKLTPTNDPAVIVYVSSPANPFYEKGSTMNGAGRIVRVLPRLFPRSAQLTSKFNRIYEFTLLRCPFWLLNS